MTSPLLRCPPRIAALALPALLLACTPKADTAPAAQRGYLAPDETPNSLALSPMPPKPGSLWAKLDETIAANALALQDSTRFAQARADAEMGFPASAEHFACALGVTVDTEHTPTLYRLLERSRFDASATTRAAKHHYQRPRPFILNGQPTCAPEHEDILRGNGSYPSGHTTAGWIWALILGEIAPERSTELFQRARHYGQSRLVCNVHWYSDVVQGQALAAAAVAKLHTNAEFLADLSKAREEFAEAKARALPLPRDCAAEAEALAAAVVEMR